MKREGWGVTRTCANFAFTEYVAGKGYQKSSIPDGFWQQPDTGSLMLKPHVFTDGWEQDPAFDYERMTLSEFDLGTRDDGLDLFKQSAGVNFGGARSRRIVVRHHDKTQDFGQVSSMMSSLIYLIQTVNNNNMGWAMRTKTPLLMNEGFGVNVVPSGVQVDRADPYFGLNWGRRWYFEIKMTGFGILWENMAENPMDAQGRWVKRKTLNLSEAGINMTNRFQVAIIPFGDRYIHIQVGQSYSMFSFAKIRFGKVGAFKVAHCTHDISENGLPIDYSSLENQWIKTESAHVHIALRLSNYTYELRPFRIRYPQQHECTLSIEDMGYPRPVDFPSMDAFGYRPGDSEIDASYYDAKGGVFNKDVNSAFVPRMIMYASANKVYTPELWYFNSEVGAETYTPPWTPYSAPWQYIRIPETLRLGASNVEVKTPDEDRWQKIYKKGGPFRITIDGDVECDGYFKRNNPTVTGMPESHGWQIDNESEGEDLWHRLDHTPIGEAPRFDGESLGPTIVKYIKRCAFADAEIVVDDAEINDIKIEDFVDLNDLKTLNADTRCGELIRELCKKLGVQNRPSIYVRPIQGVWHIGFKSVHIQGDPDPYLNFCFGGVGPTNLPDADRYRDDLAHDDLDANNQRWIWIHSNIEVTVALSRYNLLKVISTKNSGGEVEATGIFIEPHPDVLDNPASQLFEGRLRPEIIGPPEITATKEDDMERQGRRLYDMESRDNITISFDGEWQKRIRANQKCRVLGYDNEGMPCQLGIFRIEHIDRTIDADTETGERERSHLWTGDYVLTYLGPGTDEEWPMFSTFLPPEIVPG